MYANLGGTELLEPLKHIYSQPLLPGLPRQVFVLTDGSVSNTSACILEVKKHVTHTRVFTFGIGSGASTELVRGLARAGNGTAEFVHEGERMQPKVIASLKRALQPAVTDLSVTFNVTSGFGVMQAPAKLPVIFNGDKTTLYGIFKSKALSDDPLQSPLSGSATLTGKILGEAFEHNISFDIPEPSWMNVSTTTAVVHQLAAKALIQDKQSDSANKQEVIDLSIESSVISSHTAYIAVDEDQDKPIEGAVKVWDILATSAQQSTGLFGARYGGLGMAVPAGAMGGPPPPGGMFGPPPTGSAGPPPPPPSQDSFFDMLSAPPPLSTRGLGAGPPAPPPPSGGLFRGPPPPSRGGFVPQPVMCPSRGGFVPPPVMCPSRGGFVPQPAMCPSRGGFVPQPVMCPSRGGFVPPPVMCPSRGGFVPPPAMFGGPPPPTNSRGLMLREQSSGSVDLLTGDLGSTEPSLPSGFAFGGGYHTPAPGAFQSQGLSFGGGGFGTGLAKSGPITSGSSEALSKVLSLQHAQGYWELEQAASQILHLSLGVLTDKVPVACEPRVWATVLVLAYLELKFAGQKDEWELVAMKGEMWLEGQVDQSRLTALQQAAKTCI